MADPQQYQTVIPYQNDGGNFRISALSPDAGTVRVSSIPGFSYQSITTSAQTQVKGSAGVLGGITLNTTLVSAVRAYDNTVSGGTTILTIPSGATAGTNYRYGLKFSTGLVISSGAAADNITVMYI